MTTSKGKKLLVLINIFTVDPTRQQTLIDLLNQATQSSVRHVAGFVSATLHRSLDGTKVAMYARWRSVEGYQAMRNNSTASPYLEQALALAKFELGMYEVVATYSPAAGILGGLSGENDL
jgi:quinol monooxygenase YgiN